MGPTTSSWLHREAPSETEPVLRHSVYRRGFQRFSWRCCAEGDFLLEVLGSAPTMRHLLQCGAGGGCSPTNTIRTRPIALAPSWTAFSGAQDLMPGMKWVLNESWFSPNQMLAVLPVA